MINQIRNYFVSSFEEMKKVIWPSRKEVINHTIIVVASIVVTMAIIAALDFGLFNLLQKLIQG